MRTDSHALTTHCALRASQWSDDVAEYPQRIRATFILDSMSGVQKNRHRAGSIPFDRVGLQLSVHRRSGDSQQLRRLWDISLGPAKGFLDQTLFPKFDIERIEFDIFLRLVQRQVTYADLIADGQHHGAVDDVPQLPYISWPSISEQFLAGCFAELDPVAAMLPREVVEEMVDQ